MSQLTLNVPTIQVDERAFYVTLVLIGAALVTITAYEIIKRRYTTKQLKEFGELAQKRSKVAVAVILASLSTLFTTLGYLLFLAQDHMDLLQALPFVGKHVMTVLGTGWLIYNLRLNKTFQNVSEVLGKWTTKKQPTETELTLDGQPQEELV